MHVTRFISKPGFAGLLAALLLSACASQVPLNIREAPDSNADLGQVRADAAPYMGQQVRWGGTIISTENRADVTWLTVLGRPLYKDGKPEFTDDSAGRFIAVVPEFLEPEVFAPDRQVTVTGTLARTEAGKVGAHPYIYPVVNAEAWYLWPVETRRNDYDPWYDPWFYDPWYPFGYPYRHWH